MKLKNTELEMVGLAGNDAAQLDQRVDLVALCQRLQSHRHLQRHWHRLVGVVFLCNAQRQQLGVAGLKQGVGDGFVEAGLHDPDGEFLAIGRGSRTFVCAEDGRFRSVLIAVVQALRLR